jgi:hypothetical protein
VDQGRELIFLNAVEGNRPDWYVIYIFSVVDDVGCRFSVVLILFVVGDP